MEHSISLYMKTYEKQVSKLLVMVISIPLYTNALGSAFAFFGVSTQISTFLIYSGVWLYTIFKVIPLSRRKLVQLLLTLSVSILIIGLNYWLIPESRVYFHANRMELALMLSTFIPTAVYLLDLKNLELFFEGMKKVSLITPILGLISYYVFHIYNMMNYMVF
ncbi:MAG: hypothetical protein Q4D76_19315, partial [Oscillospiraceae bacterium]|nr:hypothetical protein [Oscillospiraceae bacterium]